MINKVFKSREKVPMPEYSFFMDILLTTIRVEIACCLEKSYLKLEAMNAMSLLYIDNQIEFFDFCKNVFFY